MKLKSLLTFLILIAVGVCPCHGYGHLISLALIAKNHNGALVSQLQVKVGTNTLLFKSGSRIFIYNGIMMPLGHPVVESGGKFCIDSSDYAIHVAPLLNPKQYKRLINTIILDPGHGGKDDGAVSPHNKLKEKILSMDLCVRLAKLLKSQGYKVVFTREEDVYVSLSDRGDLPSKVNGDLFVSIHLNSAESQQAHGIETFVLTPFQQPSSARSQPANSRCVGNKYDEFNTLLGWHIQSSMVNTLNAKDRGVKQGRLQVLRQINCPGVLVECLFLSNEEDAKKIALTKYRNKIAYAIFKGIIEFAR